MEKMEKTPTKKKKKEKKLHKPSPKIRIPSWEKGGKETGNTLINIGN